MRRVILFLLLVGFGLLLVEEPLPKISKVPVRFISDGVPVVGNLYVPAAGHSNRIGIVVLGYQSGTKEMVAGTYAEILAEQGFVTLAFDPRSFGESGGYPRLYENADWKIRDLSAAVNFLKSRSEVEPEALAVMGLCCGAGHAIVAASRDPNIKALVLVAGNISNPEFLRKNLKYYDRFLAAGIQARQKYRSTGKVDYVRNVVNDGHFSAMPYEGAYDYFAKFEQRPETRWENLTPIMSIEPFLTFNPHKESSSLKIPVMVIHSDDSTMPDQAKKFYEQLQSEKELVWFEKTKQYDFFDDADRIRDVSDNAKRFFHKFIGRPTLASTPK